MGGKDLGKRRDEEMSKEFNPVKNAAMGLGKRFVELVLVLMGAVFAGFSLELRSTTWGWRAHSASREKLSSWLPSKGG
jgi:hypothetical protein